MSDMKNHFMRRFAQAGIILLLPFGLTHCGGGRTAGTQHAPDPSNPPDTEVVTLFDDAPDRQAPVTTIGRIARINDDSEITVNGFVFDISGASVDTTGHSPLAAPLGVGTVVTITTADRPGIADVTIHHLISGPVTSVDLANGTLMILHQQVRFDADTIFDDVTRDTLMPDYVVSISGFLEEGGTILATRISLMAPSYVTGVPLQVAGIVSGFDPATQTFSIGDLQIDTSTAEFEEPLPADGQAVIVSASALPTGSTLIADDIQPLMTQAPVPEPPADGTNAGEPLRLSLSGPVTNFISTTQFNLHGIAVTTNADTLFPQGDRITELAAASQVRVTGTLTPEGILTATEVVTLLTANGAIEAPVDRFDEKQNTLYVLNQPVAITPDTLIRTAGPPDDEFELDDLRSGDFVRLGVHFDGQQLSATLVEVMTEPGTPLVEGTIESVTPPDLDVLGILVTLDDQTTITVDGDPFSFADFFDYILWGDKVKARGSAADGRLFAESVMATSVFDDELNLPPPPDITLPPGTPPPADVTLPPPPEVPPPAGTTPAPLVVNGPAGSGRARTR